MAKKSVINSCITVYREAMIFYSPEQTQLVSLPMTSEIIQDLEIVNQSALERVIKNWIRQTQIIPKNISIIFTEETYFYKDISNSAATLEDPEVLAFTQTVPFDNTVSKIFPIQSGSRISVINRDLINPIVSTLGKAGFTVVSATPAFAVGISKDNPFSLELAKQILSNPEILSSYNFVNGVSIKDLEEEKPFLSLKFDKRLMIMIAVFGALLGVLVVLLLFQMNS
jgi:hypothetical protein